LTGETRTWQGGQRLIPKIHQLIYSESGGFVVRVRA